MSDQQIIITVSGVDKVGIVAKVSAVLAEYEVNIEDIKQTLMQGHFVMFMLGMEIWIQRKEIFDNMHNI